MNSIKCSRVTFTLKKKRANFRKSEIQQTNFLKYFGLRLDSKPTWKIHTREKMKQIKTNREIMNCFITSNSKLNTNSKLRIYKTIAKPVWTYWIQIWSMAVEYPKVKKIESPLRPFIPRSTLNAPWYVRNRNR